jgi:hypothetical protein
LWVTELEVLLRSSPELNVDPLSAMIPAVPRSSVPLEPDDEERLVPLPFSIRSVVTVAVEVPASEVLEPTDVAE